MPGYGIVSAIVCIECTKTTSGSFYVPKWASLTPITWQCKFIFNYVLVMWWRILQQHYMAKLP